MYLKNMQKFNFSYDKENDDLFLYSPNSKSKGSVELGDIILDFDNKKELVGIEIMGASQLIRDLMDEENQEFIGELLNDLKECKISVKMRDNLLMIRLFLISNTKEISPMLSVPTIQRTSPALGYA